MSWRDVLRARPLALLAIAATAGIVIADRLPSSGSWLWLLPWLVLPCVLGFAVWRTGRMRWLALLAMIVFAAWHQSLLLETRDHPLRRELMAPGATVDVVAEGVVKKPLRSDLPGNKPWDAYFIASSISCGPLGKVYRGRTPLRMLAPEAASLPPGQYRITGRMRAPPLPDNPGEFNRRDYDLRLGLAAELQAFEVVLIEKDAFPVGAVLVSAAERCRLWFAEVLSIDLQDRPVERAIILAMALGTLDAESKELEKPFRESGTLHIFAVSGLHVVIVGFIIMAFLKPFVSRRSVLLVLLISSLFGYAFLTGLKPSAVRAAVMAATLLLGGVFNRRNDIFNALGAAALLLLVLDTNQIFAPGFQLSFGVLAAIAILSQLVKKRVDDLIDPDAYLPRQLLKGPQKAWWRVRQYFASVTVVSAAAFLGSLPLIFYHFHLVTPVSLFANALLVPLSFAVLGTAMLTLVAGAIHWGWLQSVLSNANLGFAWCTMGSAQLFSGIPMGNFYLPPASFEKSAPAELHVLRLSKGAGAQHLRIGDRHWLFDCGGRDDYPYVLRPCLRHLGVNHLDGLILSHGDFAHIGAAQFVQRDFRTERVYASAREPWKWDVGLSSMRQLRKDGMQGAPLAHGETLDLTPGAAGTGRAHARVLYPLPDVWPRRADDRTLILGIEVMGHRILWVNDAGFVAEKALLRTVAPADLRCEIIIRNQHAADFSLLPEFLDAVQPRLVITSSDSFPPEQKLPRRVIEQCAARNIRLLDQELHGAAILRLWPERIEVRPFRDHEPFVIDPRAAP